MAISPDIFEVRHQAQDLLIQHGYPLPGELQVIEAFGKRLEELHAAELEGRKRFGSQALVNLQLWLMQPGLAGDLLKQSQNEEPAISIHSEEYNQIRGYVKLLPFRGIIIPVNGRYNRNSLSIWSTNWEVEEIVSQAAKDAVEGKREFTLPVLTMDECSIKFSPRENSTWCIMPSGEIIVKHGDGKPRQSRPNIVRFSKMLTRATNYFASQPQS